MKDDVLNESSLLFKENVWMKEVREYGYAFVDFVESKKALPPEGLQFDIHFEGQVIGSRVNGTISGVDYLTVRADGRLFLNLHAKIETSDGAMIKVIESGTNDNGVLRLSMDFHTNDPRYSWLNRKHVWASGEVDFRTSKVSIQAYQH